MEQKLENFGELVDIAGGFHSAREFLDHAALATNREKDADEDMVSLMTLHKAKGLEFPHVSSPRAMATSTKSAGSPMSP